MKYSDIWSVNNLTERKPLLKSDSFRCTLTRKGDEGDCHHEYSTVVPLFHSIKWVLCNNQLTIAQVRNLQYNRGSKGGGRGLDFLELWP